MKNQEKNVLKMPEELIIDMNEHLPGDLTISDIQRLFRGRPFKVCFYLTEELLDSDVVEMDLSVRATNALKRAGFFTVGDILRADALADILGKIRNCGEKSKAEIMGKLFFYQYSLISSDRRTAYMNRLLAINGIRKRS